MNEECRDGKPGIAIERMWVKQFMYIIYICNFQMIIEIVHSVPILS